MMTYKEAVEQCEIVGKVLTLLKANRHRLTRQQFNTLKGQALAGDVDGAAKGLLKLLKKCKQKETEETP